MGAIAPTAKEKEFDPFEPEENRCKEFAEAHTSIYRNRRFYILMTNTDHPQISDLTAFDETEVTDEIVKKIRDSLSNSTFIALDWVTIKAYAEAGGKNVPYCLRNCAYNEEWPRCMRAPREHRD